MDPKLSNVLLIGDSITRNYPNVLEKLAHSANVYLFASSTSLGDPLLPGQLAESWSMEEVCLQVLAQQRVASLELHGGQYGGALSSFPSEARLVLTTSTAVRDDSATGATNARIYARNNIATAFFTKRGIPIDNQHRLMLDRCNDYQDPVHFNGTGSTVQAEQVAGTIQDQLAEK